MRVEVTVLASALLLGTAPITPAQDLNDNQLPAISPVQTRYAVDGLALGSRVKSDSAAYREYKCSPSQQFDGFTWCQKARNEKERRGPITATYSILHAKDGSVIYVNRGQEPAFLGRNDADKDIQQYSGKIGESARITKMPHRAGLPDGIIALWGKTTLEPLDQDSIKILVEGKSPKKGLLVDFIGNFARSAKEGLPIYRIGGGPGALWAGSFDQGARGTLRFAAVDASGLPSLLPDQAADVIVAAAQQGNAPEASVAELKQTIETLKAELAKSVDRIAQLETENAKIERQAPLDAENATERAKVTERANLDAMRPQFEADKAAVDARWEIAVFGAIIGAIAFLTIIGLVQLIRSRKATKGEHQLSAAIVPEQAKPSKSFDEGDLITHLAETLGVQEPTVSLSDLAPTLSESVVPEGHESAMPENPAKSDGKHGIEPGDEAKPSKSFDQGDLFAETLGVQEPDASLSDLAPAPWESVVPESPAKSDGRCIESGNKPIECEA
jgi:hypothetical protein